MLTSRVLLSCFLRSYLIGAAFTMRGLQIIGFIYAMQCGLDALYPDAEARREAYQRYMPTYNSHPFWAPLLVGIFLSLEQRVAQGSLPPAVFLKVKDTTVYTLSAIGDSLFGGTILVAWSLTSCALLIAQFYTAAALFTLIPFILLQLFRLACFILGYRENLAVLQRIKKLRLMELSDYIKVYNAIILAILMYLAWPHNAFASTSMQAIWWLWSVLFMGIFSYALQRFPTARIYIIMCAIMGIACLSVISG
ncbi:MAG: PTS system mannose/fructose/sorbose family transporter subunit IID [Pseudomonadota bacterium]